MNTANAEIPLYERLKADLRVAMKARQHTTVTTLRSLLAAIDNAGAVELDAVAKPVVGRSGDVPRRMLTAGQVQAILQSEIAECQAALAEYQGLGKHEEVDRLDAALQVLARYLISVSGNEFDPEEATSHR